MSRTSTIGVITLALVAGTARCSRPPRDAALESRVKKVEARIDGLTCPTCVPPLKNSLARTYPGSAIDVNDDKDTATIGFADRDAFSLSAFRDAVERAKMHVMTVKLEACGTIETSDGRKWLKAGANRFPLQSDRDLPVGTPVCADGMLDTRRDPPTLYVSAVSPQM
jgi:hypothetical protein